MIKELLPYGTGIFFKGQYEPDELYPLYVQSFTCQFELKPDHIPTIQLKNNPSFISTQYLTDSNGEDITLCLTSVDLELFFQQYNVYNIEYHSGWKFKATTGLYKDYIDKWIKVKIESTLNGNKGMRTLAKLMLNALYGKFALNPKVQSKYPVYDNGRIRYVLGRKETRKPVYIPAGTFITAWARYKTITSAQNVFERFIYADTDSLHLIGHEIPEGLDISPTELGAWKHESSFNKARFLRQKSYMEHGGDPDEPDKWKWNVTCAGMPEQCKQFITFDNFHIGTTYGGKLQPQHVVGGIVLDDIDFTIKG